MMIDDKWQAECASGRGIVQEWFVRVDGDDIAIASDIRDRKGNYSEPNAKLIAAAPEMALLIREAVNKGIFQGAIRRDAISILSRLTIFHGGENDSSR